MAEEDEEVRKYVRGILKDELKPILSSVSSPEDDLSIKDLGSLTKVVTAAKSLKDVFQSPIEASIMSRFGERIANELVPSITERQAKANILDSGMMINFGGKLAESLPGLVDVVVRHFGPEKAGRWIDAAQDKWMGGVPQQNVEEAVCSFDPDLPNDLHKYMALRNINNVDDAKKMLIVEKERLISRLKLQEQQSSQQASQAEQIQPTTIKQIEDLIHNQNQLMAQTVTAFQERDKIITQLASEIDELKNERKREREREILQPIKDVEVIEEKKERPAVDVFRERIKKKVTPVEKVSEEKIEKKIVEDKGMVIEDKVRDESEYE